MERIYLDHAATTPLCAEARESMVLWLGSEFGNPSSLYVEGRKARQAVDEARENLSGELGCQFAEVLFTSSGTEAANLAILGAALAHGGPRRRILATGSEHHAVLACAPLLERLGFALETIAVDGHAVIRVDDLRQKLGNDVLMVCVMHANNELGTIQPVAEVAAACKNSGALFMCDAVQTFGSIPLSVDELGADLIALSAHKIHGPKGVGALYVRAGTRLKPVSVGGGQERELRAGTENVAGIVGFAAAVKSTLRKAGGTKRAARDAFYRALSVLDGPEWVRSVRPEADCLEGHAHIRFPGISADSMLILLDRMGVSASSGAACSSGSLEPSHVLLAAGYSEAEAKDGLRFTFGVETTVPEAEDAALRVMEAAKRIRGYSAN